MADEYIDVLTKKGKSTGKIALKSVVHKKGLWHGVIHVFVFNAKGELLVQQRAKTKKTFPGLWDVSIGGHIGKHENPVHAAIRELKEELNIQAQEKDLIYKGIYSYEDIDMQKKFIEREHSHTYILIKNVDIKKIKLQKEEVQSVKWITKKAFLSYMKTSKVYTSIPQHAGYYAAILNAQ